MAKREILSTTTVTKDDILNRIDELGNLMSQYFSQFHKSTPGQQSVGEVGLSFLEQCADNIDNFPEILPGTFDKADFNVKAQAVFDFKDFKQKMVDTIAQSDTSAKIVKTDAMYYANEFYGMLQKESTRNIRYKPLLDNLTAFYKKSKSDKTTDTKPKTTSTAQ